MEIKPRVFFTIFNVKLNNPLMGTETHRPMTVQIQFHHINVKLNNPLMGTETIPLLFLR